MFSMAPGHSSRPTVLLQLYNYNADFVSLGFVTEIREQRTDWVVPERLVNAALTNRWVGESGNKSKYCQSPRASE
jgi:hypothetical protein